jgi:hypothetical protein
MTATPSSTVASSAFAPGNGETLSPQVPLYHYTDARGFSGIMQTRALWATDALYLNDSTEVAWGLDVFRTALHAYQGSMKSRVDEIVAMVEREVAFQLFIVSFTELGNDLSQWRGYAPNGGYAIEFPPEAVMGLCGLTGGGFGRAFRPIVYDTVVQAECARLVVDQFVRDLEQLNDHWWDIRKGEFAHDFTGRSLTEAVWMKHPKFIGEKEWRLVVSAPSSEQRFRVTRSLLTPYVPVQFGANVLTSIGVIVGPTPHQRLANRAAVLQVESALLACGIDLLAGDRQEKVRDCGIPYVTW